MKKFKLKLGLALFILGLIGVLSLLTVPFSVEGLPPEVLEQFSENTIRWLTLANPAFMLIVAVVLGTLLYDKVKLASPALESALKGEDVWVCIKQQLKFGLIGGLLAGILLILVEQIFYRMIPQEFLELGTNLTVTPLARFLYGGITEEILLRYGLMTFLVWILYRISKSLKAPVYWIAILISSLLFAAAHLPVAYQAVESPSLRLILYILTGNMIGGIIFGWLYWKKGLEAAIIAHMMVHVVILTAGWLL